MLSDRRTRRANHARLVLLCAVIWGAFALLMSCSSSRTLVQDVLEYRAARAADDSRTAARFLSPSPRIWFEEKTGEGKKIDHESGGGPWAEWDEFFQASGEAGEFVAEGNQVTALVTETNDYFRLIERSPSHYRVTYYFDANGLIEGILIESESEREKRSDRLDEFREWMGMTHPGQMEYLMPGGEYDPSLEKARWWRTYLNEWRRETGRPAIGK